MMVFGHLFCAVLGACGNVASEASDTSDTSSSHDAEARSGSHDAKQPPVIESAGCAHADDLSVFDASPDLDIDGEIRACVMPLVIAGSGPGSDEFVERVASCLASETGLSTGCATCYAQNAECSFEDCGIICLPDPTAPDCQDCRCGRTGGVNCFDRLAECTGLPTDRCD